MTKFKILTIFCVLSCAADFSWAGDTPVQYGMKMTVKAYDAVCWYSYLKIFPNSDTEGYRKCSGKAEFQRNYMETNNFYVEHPEMREASFGKAIDKHGLKGLPRPYQSKCKKFLKDSKAAPEKDESDALNDNGSDYPYKAFCYCLMSTLRETNGDKAIDAVKKERTHGRKPWMQVLLDRDNEFRARHGAPPFTLLPGLNEDAQTWAQDNADKCKSYHSKGDAGKYKGEDAGESIAAGHEDEDNMDVGALISTDSWYGEIKDYPFPDSWQTSKDPGWEDIGHFTQTVWNSTKYVGYGMVINPDCKKKNGKQAYSRYTVARYFPPGNMDYQYENNVFPPKDS